MKWLVISVFAGIAIAGAFLFGTIVSSFLQEWIAQPSFPTSSSSTEKLKSLDTQDSVEDAGEQDVEEKDSTGTKTTPSASPPPQLSFDVIGTQTRGATVNILCKRSERKSTQITSGSGTIIDRRGVVLTNAHVAQMLLLVGAPKGGGTECSIRTGNPATELYDAILLYLPPAWINRYAADIDNPEPLGTGEDDYALLLITDTAGENEFFPNTFPFVSPELNQDLIDKGDYVLVTGYPAETASKSEESFDTLAVVSTITTINELFTLKEDTLDLFSLKDSTLSYKGSSGGAVISDSNKLIGIITTRTDEKDPSERELRAVTLAHIERSLRSYTGSGLNALLSGDLHHKAKLFTDNIAPTLTKQLLWELNN